MYDLPFDLMVRRATADIADALTAPPPAPPAPGAPPPAPGAPPGMGAPPPGMPPQGVPPQGVPPQGVSPQPAMLPRGGLPPQIMAMLQARQGQPPRSFKTGGSVSSADMAVRPTRRPNPYEAEILATDWAKGYQKKYGEKPDVSDASNYDYETAWRLGVRPKATKHDDLQHWSSRAPDGTMLKKPGHPTAWKEEYMQEMGEDPDDAGVTEEQFKAKPRRFAAGGGAWTRKEGKNPEGGLNAKGRASLKAQGHDIKPPVSAKLAAKSPKAAARRKSFCARMTGMPGPMKDEQGRPTRKALSLRKWDC